MEIGTVCNEFVLDFGLVLIGVEGPRDIFGELEWKRICEFTLMKGAVFEFGEHVLDGIEIFISRVFPPVLWTSLKPLAVLVAWIGAHVPSTLI